MSWRGPQIAAALLLACALAVTQGFGASGKSQGQETASQSQSAKGNPSTQPSRLPSERQKATPANEKAANKPTLFSDPFGFLGAVVGDPDNTSNFLIMLFTGVLTFVAIEQSKLQRSNAVESAAAIKIAGESALAAKAAARAAELSAQTQMNAERAYLLVESIVLETLGTQTVAVIYWKNYGKTAAMVTKIQFDCSSVEREPKRPKEVYGPPIPSGTVVGSGDVWTKGTMPMRQPIADFEAGKLVYAVGQITYFDISRTERHTWFCYQFGGEKFFSGIYVDPELNDYD